MYPGYVSRRYLNEKFSNLNEVMKSLEIDNDSIEDKIDNELVERDRFAIRNYCEAILNEFGW